VKHMGYFKDANELDEIVGGFLRKFPKIDPVLKSASDYTPMMLKLELTEPELTAEIDLVPSPLEIRFGSNAFGTIGMSGPADNFHELLQGYLSMAIAINEKRLMVRGSMAKLMKAVPLFYISPAIYPFYLESIGRSDLLLKGSRPLLHTAIPREDKMTKIIAVLAYLVGYALGFVKARIAPKLDIVDTLESMGKGLLKGSGKAPAEPQNRKE